MYLCVIDFDRDCMVVKFTCAISAYHRYGDVYSIQIYVIKFVTDLRYVGGFLHQ